MANLSQQLASLEVEKLFLMAAERGDKMAVMIAMKNAGLFNVNCIDEEDRSALVLAIENGNFDIVELLASDSRIDLGDSLLRATNLQFIPAVWTICKCMKQRKLLPEGLNTRSLNSDFHPDITPVIIAAQNNNYEILKILLDHGAKIEEPDSYNFFTEEFTLEHSVGTINVHRALTSEAFIALTSDDPISRAFELSDLMQNLSTQNFEFRSQFEQLAIKCEVFASELLTHVRNTQEQITVLTHDPEEWSRDNFHGDFKAAPYKVKAAIDCDQKKFVAHPHCQQRLAERWYHGLEDWRKHSAWRNLFYSCFMMAGFPILSLGFILSAKKLPGRLLTIPYVRFICHMTSQFLFLIFLAIHYVDINQFNTHEQDKTDDKKLKSEKEEDVEAERIGRKIHPTGLEYVIIIWVIAMTWQELSNLFQHGKRCMKSQAQTKFFDICTLCLYWAWISIRIVAAMQVVYSLHEDPVKPDLNRTLSNITTIIPEYEISQTQLPPDYLNSSELSIESESISVYENAIMNKVNYILDTQAQMNDEFTKLLDAKFSEMGVLIQGEVTTMTPEHLERVRRASSAAARKGARRKPNRRATGSSNSTLSNLSATHPLLIAEGLLSLAKVVSFLRIIRVTVVHLHIGPMQISFGRMGGDILKFGAIFSLILIAFSVGLSELYHLYTEDYESLCEKTEKCKIPYKDVKTALTTLFWTLFGMTDLRSLDVTVANHWITELVGYFLFAVYHIVAIVALFNILIAMMSNTYNRIEEDADIQWKFCRSTLWISYYEENSSLYPPFNLIPTLESLKLFYFWKLRKGNGRHIMRVSALDLQKKKKIVKIQALDDEYKELMRELVQRYFFVQKSISEEQGSAGPQTWMLQIKHEVTSFKYDTFEALGTINKTMKCIKHTVEGSEEECGDEDEIVVELAGEFLRAMESAIKRAEEANLPIRPEIFTKNGMAGKTDIPFIDSETDLSAPKRKSMRGRVYHAIEKKPHYGTDNKGTRL
ncbi:short transient receptor potential channel 4-like [Glandiceps talaboti]